MRFALFSVALLAACGNADPTTARDATPEAMNTAPDAVVAVDASVDHLASDVPIDVTVSDIYADTTGVADVLRDVPAAFDVADGRTDAARDAAADLAPALDVVDDRNEEDVGVPCVENAVRCADSRTVETCVVGVWYPTACARYNAATSSLEECVAGACYFCTALDGGAGCSFSPPLCTTNEACYRRGGGQCVDGRCAPRGPVECATQTDCVVWTWGTGSPECAEAVVERRRTRVCGTVRRCTGDPMCPIGYRCDVTSGFCARL